MNLLTLASHTIDLDVLPAEPIVLDAGCRGFDFTLEILRWAYASVVAMDLDASLAGGAPGGVLFVAKALVGDGSKSSPYADFSTGEANFLCERVPHYATERSVECVSITELMRELSIAHWDLVKLDIESSEFAVLENWPGPIATQISVEFHDWTDRERWNDAYYERLFSGPLKDYDVLSHELTTVGPGPAWGHWDSVLRLKGRG
jgi:hypothetical protein